MMPVERVVAAVDHILRAGATDSVPSVTVAPRHPPL